MKQLIIYFVEDAYGYLVNTDELGFFSILDTWNANDCKHKITTEVKNGCIVTKLWRE